MRMKNVKQPSLEETIVNKIGIAKATTQEKYFKQFCSAKDETVRNEIGSKMSALDSVTFDLIKGIRGNIE